MNDSVKKVRKKIKKHKSESFKYGQLIILDIITMIFSLAPGILSWLAVISYVKYFWNHSSFIFLMIPLPLILAFSYIIGVRLIRFFIPKVKPGVYKIGLSRRFLGWYLNLCMANADKIFGVQSILYAFYFIKYIYWRAMGAKVAYGTNSSVFIQLRDYPILKIGRGCTLGANVFISGHTFVGSKVLIGEVNIGNHVYLGMGCVVGPKTTIGSNSWIGMHNKLLMDILPENSKLENFEWEHFSPKNNETSQNTKGENNADSKA